jgi:hypothetical protein
VFDEKFAVVFEAIRQLMAPPATPRRQIGFKAREKRAAYSVNKKKKQGKKSTQSRTSPKYPGKYAGGIDYSAVSQSRKRLQNKLLRDSKLSKRFNRICEQLAEMSNCRVDLAVAQPGPPQIRTCAINASGSSESWFR